VKRKDDNKAREILAAAVRVVEERGIAGLSMEAVAQRAGVAAATLYVYHPGKEALLNAAYRAAKQALTERVFFEEPLPVRPAFLRTASRYLEYLLENRPEVAFMEQLLRSTFLSEETRRLSDEGVKTLFDLLERGKREELLKPLDSGLMIAFLRGALGELSWSIADAPRRRRAALVDQAATVCWDALKL
jgi:TetR/AcrR family transcriptional regulator, repressor of fatR-cypB operon